VCTKKLIQRAKDGDKNAAEQLIAENAGLIWSIVRRFFRCGLEPDDLYQLGCLGFLKAINGFDHNYGTQFSTYAVPKIAGEIRRFIRDDGMIKVSRSIKENKYRLEQTRLKLENELGRTPLLSELAKSAGMSPEEIAICDLASTHAESLQKTTGEDGFTLESAIGDDGIEDIIIENESIRSAIRQLPERERTVIYLRFYKNLTQERVARFMGVSQVQVSRIEKKAITILKEQIG